MTNSDRTLVTRLVGERFRSDLSPVIPHWSDATHAAAVDRQACIERHAVLVLASWLDEDGATQLRSWLRGPAERAAPIAVAVGYHPHVDVGPIYGACLRHALIVADPAFRPGV